MAAKEISVKKYVVKLTGDERRHLHELIRTGKRSAQLLMKARIRLKADTSSAGEGWSDSQIVKALETSLASAGRANNWWKRASKRRWRASIGQPPPGHVFSMVRRRPN